LPDGKLLLGRMGQEVDVAGGYQAARQAGLAMLATLRTGLGSLDRVQRIVKTLGIVNCVPNFTQHPAVINGFSELMAQVFGPDQGVGARSAFGTPCLPGNMTVEVEAIFEIA
jgi:enamine deaminase RidA (YjgF/YER057c/UK114 family)